MEVAGRAGSVRCDLSQSIRCNAKLAEFRVASLEVDKIDSVVTGEMEMESVAGWMNHASAVNVLLALMKWGAAPRSALAHPPLESASNCRSGSSQINCLLDRPLRPSVNYHFERDYINATAMSQTPIEDGRGDSRNAEQSREVSRNEAMKRRSR